MWLDFDSPAGPHRIRANCRSGTPLGDVTAALGLAPGPWWCGPQVLEPTDRAGTAPLHHGALVTPQPAPAGPLWLGARFVSIAGPDVGRIVPVINGATLGSASLHGWRDPSVDPHHAAIEWDGGSRVTLCDADSANGMRVWDPDAPQRWSPLRRRLTLSSGDCALLGRTVIQFRAAGVAVAPRFDASPWLDPTVGLHHHAAGRWQSGGVWWRQWWHAPLVITGPHRVGLARAIMLARGRQLPSPSPLAEPWQELLPPADAHDGLVGWAESARGSVTKSGSVAESTVHLTTTIRGATLSHGRESLPIPLCSVQADSAEAIARAIVSMTPSVPPILTRGDLPAGAGVGVGADDTTTLQAVWELSADRAWTVLVAGAAGSGKSTALVSVMAGFRDRHSSHGGVAHVVSPADAATGLAEVRRAGTRRALLVVDDAHLLDTTVLQHVVELTRRRDPHLSVAIAAERAAGTFAPDLIARADALICLRTRTADESRDFIGVGDAASLPAADPGLAYVRSGATRRLIRIALPSAVPSPAARVT